MMTRVTVGSALYGALNGMQSTSSKLAALQSQLSSGRQITKPSDNPAGTATALQLRGELARTNQYQANGTDALSYLTQLDSTMSSLATQLQKVRSLVVQGLNTGSSTGTSNEALAQQVDQIRQSMLSLANTTSLGRPIFGGTTTGSAAFSLDSSTNTVSYVGDSGAMQRTVGPSTTITINPIGSDVFGTGNGTDPADGSPDVFELLSNISAALRGAADPTTTLNSALTSIDKVQANFSDVQATEGAQYNRITGLQSSMSTNTIQLKAQLSDLQDVDVADMAIQVSTANTAYQASLAATAQIQQTSLLDFLK